MAVLLPEGVRAALAREIERLRLVARGVAWVAPENLHVTLKFLGEVDEARLPSLREALAGAAAPVPPFDLAVRGLGAFPSVGRPRVIWAGLGEGADAAAELARRVDEALASLGFPREDRPFAGHVTLGRVREPRRHPALTAAIEAGGGRDFGLVRVDAAALMQSRLSPHGARYTRLESAPLDGR